MANIQEGMYFFNSFLTQTFTIKYINLYINKEFTSTYYLTQIIHNFLQNINEKVVNKNNLILFNTKIRENKNNINILFSTIVNITKNVKIFLNLSSKLYSTLVHKDSFNYIIKIKKILNILKKNKKNNIGF